MLRSLYRHLHRLDVLSSFSRDVPSHLLIIVPNKIDEVIDGEITVSFTLPTEGFELTDASGSGRPGQVGGSGADPGAGSGFACTERHHDKGRGGHPNLAPAPKDFLFERRTYELSQYAILAVSRGTCPKSGLTSGDHFRGR